MGIYTAAPLSRSFSDNKPTLLVCWWCTSFSATIIMFRVTGRYIRTEKLFKEDWLALACLIPLLIRMAFVHLVLLYGTNNMQTDGVSNDILQERITGSRLVLGSRLFYAATLWMLKLTISEFFKRLTPLHLWKPSYEWTFQFIRWFLLASFIGVVISDVAECQPIYQYWQVVPDPGPHCRQGFAELITMGAFNVITDLLLIVFPIPIIIISQMSFKRKLQLTGLFGLSIIPIITTLVRIPNIIDRQGSQNYRSLWASIEILAATGVANALVLGSFVRDRGLKKRKFKLGSTSDSIEPTASRRGTVAQRHWGSEEDLVRDFGFVLDPELRDNDAAPRPRQAPIATGRNGTVKLDQNWRFPSADAESEESDMVKIMNDTTNSPGEVSFISSPRKVSFFDVGGLLDGDSSSTSRRRKDSFATEEGSSLHPTMSHDSHSPISIKKGSKALLQDLGGLLNSPPSQSSRTPRGVKQIAMELQPMPANRDREGDRTRPPIQKQHSATSFQDVGGLLHPFPK